MKHQDKFIKNSFLLGAALLLAACGPKNDQQASDLNQIESDSITSLAQETIPPMSAESVQTVIESNLSNESQITTESVALDSNNSSQPVEASGQFVDGTYQAVGPMNELGWKPQQNLTVTDGKITDIQFDYVNADNNFMSQDTEYNMQMKQAQGKTAIETINTLEESFLKAPDREVDTISGATQMSNDFKTSLAVVKEAASRGDSQVQTFETESYESTTTTQDGYHLESLDESESGFIQVIEDESESTTSSSNLVIFDPAQSSSSVQTTLESTTTETTTTSQTSTTSEPESLSEEESISESESESIDETVASLLNIDETSQDESQAEVKREHTVNPKLINMTGTTTTQEDTSTTQSTTTTETSVEDTTMSLDPTTQIIQETSIESTTTTVAESKEESTESSSDSKNENHSDETPIFKDGEYHNVMDANDKGWAMTHKIFVENGKIVASEFDYVDKDGNLMSKDPEVEKEYLKSTGVPTKKLFELMSEAFVREQRADLFTIKGAEDLVADFQASVKAFFQSAETGKTETIKVAPVKKEKEAESHDETTVETPVTEEAPAGGPEIHLEGPGIAN